MLKNMRKRYCKGVILKTKKNEVKLAGGKTMYLCSKAKGVFYATMRKNRWDESKARPSATEETLNWFLRKKGLI